MRWAERLAGARHTNDKLLPSRNSQSVSTFTCQLAFPTVEMARRARGKTHRFAIVFLDSGSEICPAVSDSPKALAPEPESPLCPDPKEQSELFREDLHAAKAGKSPGQEATRGGTLLGALLLCPGWVQLAGPPLELIEGTCLGQQSLEISGSQESKIFMEITQLFQGPRMRISSFIYPQFPGIWQMETSTAKCKQFKHKVPIPRKCFSLIQQAFIEPLLNTRRVNNTVSVLKLYNR